MRIYYLNRNQEFLGPYSLDDLRSQPITKDDVIWKDGAPDWVHAEELEEFACMFKSEIKNDTAESQYHKKDISSFIKWWRKP